MKGSPLDPEVLQVITDADRRGAQVAAIDLHEALAKRGRVVRTVALAPGRATARLDVPVLGPSRFASRTLRTLRGEMLRANTVVACGSSTLPACTLAGTASGVPLIYRSIGDLPFWTQSVARRARVRFELGRSAAVVALWRAAGLALTERFRVPRNRVHVIPNGVPALRFPIVHPEERTSARRRLDLDPTRPTLAALGALTPEKDVGLAIAALKDLPDCQLLIAGDGPERSRLEAIASQHAPRRVRFIGVTENPGEVYAATDVLLLPSRSEGMPAVVIEAGLSGIPVVATDVGGVGDVVRPGRTGELVPEGDASQFVRAIRRALDRGDVYGPAARRHCLAHFEIAVVADRWEQLLREVARRH